MRAVIEPDGTIETLYTEEIDLTALGALSMRRASNVEWNEACQEWVVTTLDGVRRFANASRQVCLDWESDHIPLSPTDPMKIETAASLLKALLK